MTEVAWPPKADIFYETEKKVCGGFSEPIEIAYTFFGDSCWEVQMQNMRLTSKEEILYKKCRRSPNSV